MKRLAISLLAALATSAHATIIFYAQNQNGGTIQFSDMPCSKLKTIPNLRKIEGYTSIIIDSTGEPLELGCYSYSEPNLSVTWQDGTERWYDPHAVTFTSEGKKIFEAAKKASY